MELPANQIFRLLADKADESFFIYDKNARRFKYLSPGFMALTNLQAEEIIDQPDRLLTIVHVEDRDYLQSQINLLKNEGKVHVEFRITTAGETVYIRLNAYQLDADQGLIAGWIIDVSNIKKNILYAEKINARKNSLLEILAHDLKEPVGMINMMATAIKNSPLVVGDETLQSYIRIIQQLCESNIQLIRSVVHNEFLEAQEIDLRLERVDLVWAVRDVIQQYEISKSLVNKEFYFNSEVNQLYITMDSLKIIQVVNNLVSNAIKFTPDGGRIDVNIKDLGGTVRISVSDDGIGIPEPIRPALFQPHSRAQRSGLRGEPGSGMGLSIIKTLVDLHGGRVWLDTSNETGTTFHIELPKANDVALENI